MKGVLSINVWNLVITGVIALIAVMLWNEFASGKTVFGMTLGRA